MGIGVIFSTCSFVFNILLLFIFFCKKRVNNVETRLYSYLLVIITLTSAIGLPCYYSVMNASDYPFFALFFGKAYLVLIHTWVSILSCYFVLVSSNITLNNEIRTKFKVVFLIYYIAVLTLIILLPIYYNSDPSSIYTYGPSVNLSFVMGGLIVLILLWCIIKEKSAFQKENISHNKKFIPLIVISIIGTIAIILQKSNPSWLFMTTALSIVTHLMYHTIENPDLKMINELELAKNQADKANNAKSDFLSSMSHEIRTPLNAIVGFSECIMQTDDVDEAHDNAKDVVNASETLLEIVNGILDISKIEAGKLEIVNSNYDPKKLFDDVSRLIKARIGEKPLDFQVLIAEDLPNTLYGDHANLKKIIINLLTNAVKYTEKGFVKFEVSSVKTNGVCRLMINVSDSGRGIKKENIDKLFTKFQRLDEDKNTTIEGTGLGLAITKQLTELMKGKIVVNSVYGEGSKFTVAIDQRISLEQVEKEKESNLELDLTGKRILIVDDNKLNLKVSSKLLSVYNPTIDLLEDGFSCIEKIKNNVHYDLILMDDMMPKMTGTETLQKLKEIEYFNIPVIALTANAISGMREKYLKEGFDDYLSKPMEKDEVYKVLLKYTNKDIKKEYPIKKILIVDDNNMNIKIVSNFLKQYNLVIDSALSGDECIKKINNGILYDLILMDDMMPITIGTQTMKRLKLLSFKNPIVALTANAVEGAKEQYLKEGFDDYLSKPINKNELDRVMDKFLYKQNISKIEDISM